MTSREVEDSVLAKSLDMDCVDMVLKQNTDSAPHAYRGKGFLRQDDRGRIRFRLYPQQVSELRDWISAHDPGDAGKLIPPHAFYSLSATDWYGRKWTCGRVRPDFSSTYHTDQPHGLASGVVPEFVCEEEARYPRAFYSLKLVHRTSVEFPANATTDVVTSIAGKRATSSGRLNVADFRADPGHFRVRDVSGRLVVTCEAEKAPHTTFHVRVTEALCFVLGRRLAWNFMEENREGKTITRLRGQAESDALPLPEPLGGQTRDWACFTWVLFRDYLRFIRPHTAETCHPCTRHLFSVYQAAQGTIEAKALALGVAVEGMCKDLFHESREAEARLGGWVKDLRKHCERWPGFSDPAARTALFDRLGGLISQFTTVRAKDVLVRLVSERALFEGHAKAWNRLRNPAAHGNVKGVGSTQDLVSLCGAVTVLLYHLVFKAIGYEGRYVDYGEFGHPTKYYRGRPVREEEIATAAYLEWERDGKTPGGDLARWLRARAMLEAGDI